MKQLSKLLRLNKSDRLLLLATFVLMGLVRLGLWLLPFQTLRQILAKISNSQEVEQIELGKIVWAVNVTSRYMVGNVKCLARALTTQVLMKRHGYSPQLRIGVTFDSKGQLEAHAWVENQGKVVIGYLRDLSRFSPMSSLEGDRV